MTTVRLMDGDGTFEADLSEYEFVCGDCNFDDETGEWHYMLRLWRTREGAFICVFKPNPDLWDKPETAMAEELPEAILFTLRKGTPEALTKYFGEEAIREVERDHLDKLIQRLFDLRKSRLTHLRD